MSDRRSVQMNNSYFSMEKYGLKVILRFKLFRMLFQSHTFAAENCAIGNIVK